MNKYKRVYYWKKENYECKRCGYRQKLTVDTVLQSNPLPFRYWTVKTPTFFAHIPEGQRPVLRLPCR
jgi:hypothetical protein